MGLNDLNSFGSSLNLFSFSLILLSVLVDLPLRGMALWKSAQKSQKIWFVALFIFNTVGILPLIYLLISKRQPKDS